MPEPGQAQRHTGQQIDGDEGFAGTRLADHQSDPGHGQHAVDHPFQIGQFAQVVAAQQAEPGGGGEHGFHGFVATLVAHVPPVAGAAVQLGQGHSALNGFGGLLGLLAAYVGTVRMDVIVSSQNDPSVLVLAADVFGDRQQIAIVEGHANR